MISKLRVLVVDDELFIASFLKRIVEKLGCEFSSVDDGHDVGKALLAFDPDLIFLDLIMPEIDGVEIVNLLGETNSKAKLVLMSGLDQRTISSVAEVARAQGLDVLAAITKPIEPAKIEELVRPLVESIGRKREATLSQEADKPSMPGPQLLYSEELPLTEPSTTEFKWHRIKLVWKLDDERVVDIEEVLQSSVVTKSPKGLLILCFRLLAAPELGVNANGDQIGVKIPLSLPVLLDPSAPNYLEYCVNKAGLNKQLVSFEVSETAITGGSDMLLKSLSRLKIKGFKIGIVVCTEVDRVLSMLKKLPVDEIVLDMSGENLQGATLNDSETEFQIASLVSYASKNSLTTTAINLTTSEQLAFAKQCGFRRASGPIMLSER